MNSLLVRIHRAGVPPARSLRLQLLSAGVVLLALAPGALAASPEQTMPRYQYNGPGSCSSSSCHGSISPKTDTPIQQTEYSTWIVQDKHARAYTALSNPVSIRIGKILKLDRAPNAAPKCLACHALDVPQEARARTFDMTDGVSCEQCHGPASGWLGPHTQRNWTHEQSVKLGMYDLNNLAVRTEKCLTCHLGTADKFVDHQMIAAGHPDLNFELDSYSAAMPRHWLVHYDKDPWIGVRSLSVGQAVQLREELNRLTRRAQSKTWPEYGEMDCFACHHSLTPALDSWRQAGGYPDRVPGVAPWQASRYIVLEQIVAELDPNAAQTLDNEVAAVRDRMNSLHPDGAEVAAAAQRAAAAANSLVGPLLSMNYDAATAVRLMKRISASADPIANQGERSAEQATMAVDSLFVAYDREQKSPNSAAIRETINGLFKQLENPSAYDPNRFAPQLKRVGALLGG